MVMDERQMVECPVSIEPDIYDILVYIQGGATSTETDESDRGCF